MASVFLVKQNQHDTTEIDIYTRNKNGEIIFGMVHIDLFYGRVDDSVYERLKKGEELELRIVE